MLSLEICFLLKYTPKIPISTEGGVMLVVGSGGITIYARPELPYSYSHFGSGEDDFKRFLLFIAMAAILVM